MRFSDFLDSNIATPSLESASTAASTIEASTTVPSITGPAMAGPAMAATRTTTPEPAASTRPPHEHVLGPPPQAMAVPSTTPAVMAREVAEPSPFAELIESPRNVAIDQCVDLETAIDAIIVHAPLENPDDPPSRAVTAITPPDFTSIDDEPFLECPLGGAIGCCCFFLDASWTVGMRGGERYV